MEPLLLVRSDLARCGMRKRCEKCPENSWKHFVNDERGATAIEYALIASLLAVAILTAVLALGDGTSGMFTYIFDHVSAALTGTTS